MTREPKQVFTNVLVQPLFDTTRQRWYWRAQCWYNDPVIGAQPPDTEITGKAIYKTQRGALRGALRELAGVV